MMSTPHLLAGRWCIDKDRTVWYLRYMTDVLRCGVVAETAVWVCVTSMQAGGTGLTSRIHELSCESAGPVAVRQWPPICDPLRRQPQRPARGAETRTPDRVSPRRRYISRPSRRSGGGIDRHMIKVNADKKDRWPADIKRSVDAYNEWFRNFAPDIFRKSREQATTRVKEALIRTSDLTSVTPRVIKDWPEVVAILRMCTAPPMARDRLIGLAGVKPSLVQGLEEGKLPRRMSATELDHQLERICETVLRLVDRDLFPWLDAGVLPTEEERARSASVVADRVTGANANPIMRGAQERRQLQMIESFLIQKGYNKQAPPAGAPPTAMSSGTFWLNLKVKAGKNGKVDVPVDVVIQPRQALPGSMPILIEAKSAGDFTNVNKRRKEEAQKIRQLQEHWGDDTRLILFLGGDFDTGYLSYEADAGLDWVWEHRIEDLTKLGV